MQSNSPQPTLQTPLSASSCSRKLALLGVIAPLLAASFPASREVYAADPFGLDSDKTESVTRRKAAGVSEGLNDYDRKLVRSCASPFSYGTNSISPTDALPEMSAFLNFDPEMQPILDARRRLVGDFERDQSRHFLPREMNLNTRTEIGARIMSSMIDRLSPDLRVNVNGITPADPYWFGLVASATQTVLTSETNRMNLNTDLIAGLDAYIASRVTHLPVKKNLTVRFDPIVASGGFVDLYLRGDKPATNCIIIVSTSMDQPRVLRLVSSTQVHTVADEIFGLPVLGLASDEGVRAKLAYYLCTPTARLFYLDKAAPNTRIRIRIFEGSKFFVADDVMVSVYTDEFQTGGLSVQAILKAAQSQAVTPTSQPKALQVLNNPMRGPFGRPPASR